jgi:integrase/recombinase XerD
MQKSIDRVRTKAHIVGRIAWDLQREAQAEERTETTRTLHKARAASGASPVILLQCRIEVEICCHTFRATGITNYLENGGTLEKAQQMACHESAKTTKLYDRTSD